MTACTDDERRRVAAALRAYDGKGADADTIGEVMAIIIGAGDFEGWSWREVFARLADLIEPDTTKAAEDTTKAPTSSDTTATHTDASATCDVLQSRRDTVACDPTERGIDSIHEWCRERLEGADGAEDELCCSIMRAIEEYRHPELATARTARPVDREALLALADKMKKYARLRSDHGMDVDAMAVGAWVLRIREACGVTS